VHETDKLNRVENNVELTVYGDFAPIGAWLVFCYPTPWAHAHG